MQKVRSTVANALENTLRDGMTIMSGGFGYAVFPRR